MKRVLHVMKWGLQPFWSRNDANTAKSCINARSETLLGKSMFKIPLEAGGRGVLIANGFYEWQNVADEKRKSPYFVSEENGPLYMAVVYDLPKAKANKEDQFTIITVDASPSVAWLHDRMPALLKLDQLDEWLDVKRFSLKEAIAVLKPFDGDLKVQRASPLVNSVKNDGVELISYKRTREETNSITHQYSIENYFSSSSRNKRSKSTKE
ncbi:Embryonic stem cell-specific 5-hydroxymethylcytosine-binding protein [Galdieria sulphuraria]|nr:Embryonic stem cell-specific 5-hydroxymethylcytosine-binding protein [Galdieria sulphuraria]